MKVSPFKGRGTCEMVTTRGKRVRRCTKPAAYMAQEKGGSFVLLCRDHEKGLGKKGVEKDDDTEE